MTVNPEIQTRLEDIEKQLRTLAEEVWAQGISIIINTHDGVLEYYDPRYQLPEFGGRRLYMRYESTGEWKSRWRRRSR